MGALRSRACLGAPQRRDVVKQAARRVLRQYPFQTRQKDFPRLYLVPQPQCASHAFAVGGQLLLEDADADAYLIGLCSKCCLDWPSTLHAELDLPWKRISNLRDMLWFLGIASYFPTRDSRSRPAACMPAPVGDHYRRGWGRTRELAVADAAGIFYLGEWRRGRDSNPRWACTHAAFRVRCIRPLCHLSAVMVGRCRRGALDNG